MNDYMIRLITRLLRSVTARLAVMCFALVFAAACGGSSSSSSSTGSAGGTPPSVFKIGLAEQFRDLDPDTALQNDELEIINLIGGTLTQFTADASSVEPGLAASWTTSSDGTVYT